MRQRISSDMFSKGKFFSSIFGNYWKILPGCETTNLFRHVPAEKFGIQRVTFGCPLRGMWIPRSGHPMGIRWLPPMSHQWASHSGHVTSSGHNLVTTHPDRAAPRAALARPLLAASSTWPPPPHGRFTGRRPKLASLFSSRRTRWPLLSGRRLLHGRYAGRSYLTALPAVEKSGRTAGGRRNTYMTDYHSHIGLYILAAYALPINWKLMQV